MDEPDTIAVVGGGPSAKHLLLALGHAAALGRLGAARLRVRVYEEGTQCGPGLAWHPAQVAPVHHSSLPVAVNRAAEGRAEMDRFARVCAFLRERGASVAVDCGRRVVGVERAGTAGAQDALWRVACADGPGAPARHVVLAMGHSAFGTRRTPGVDCTAPWPFARLAEAVARLDGPADVLVLGSYLSAVDVATGLAQHLGMADPRAPAERIGRMPRLHLASPSGELPKVWGRAPGLFDRQGAIRAALGTAPAAASAGVGLPEGVGLDGFARVVLHAAGTPAAAGADAVAALAALLESLCAGDARERLARDVAEVAPQPDAAGPQLEPPWQGALFGCLPLLSEAYHRFPPADRLAFLPLRARYYKAAMAMSLADARCLCMLFARGLLRVLRTGAAVVPQPHPQGGWTLDPALDPARRRYALVVDAAGPDTRLARTPSALLRGLHAAGLVSPVLVQAPGGAAVELGGVRVDPSSCAVLPAGGDADAAAGLFAMGPLVVGTFPDAQSIGHVARDAERIVRRLCGAPSFPSPPGA